MRDGAVRRNPQAIAVNYKGKIFVVMEPRELRSGRMPVKGFRVFSSPNSRLQRRALIIQRQHFDSPEFNRVAI